MSLTSCLAKANDFIDPALKSDLLARAKTLEARGQAAPGASRQAVQEAIDLLTRQLRVATNKAQEVRQSAPRDQTQTPAFKKWFGDSKVVGVEGEPLVVYHGSGSRNIKSFRPGVDGAGWFAKDRSLAQNFAEEGGGNSVYEVYLSMQNPLDVRKGWPEKERLAALSSDEPNAVIFARMGYDGLISDEYGGQHGDLGTTYLAFRPEQIKSATSNNGDFDPASKDITRSAPRSPWYSGLQQAIEGVPERLATMAAPQWRLWLDANAAKLGVKKDEVEWSGIKDYLATRGKDKVTKGEIAGYLAANGVKIEETVLSASSMPWIVVDQATGGDGFYEEHSTESAAEARVIELGENSFATLPPDLATNAGRRDDGPKYSDYTVPGGTNYREFLLTLPTAGAKDATRRQELAAIDRERHLNLAEQKEYDDLRAKSRSGGAEVYTSSHWNQKNVLAHLRVDDRTDADGNKVLMIQEIQSDWGADGRKKGFAGDMIPQNTSWTVSDTLDYADTRAEAETKMAELQPFLAQNREPGMDSRLVIREARGGFEVVEESRSQAASAPRKGGVPAGPFVTDTKAYVALALRRAIKLAVDEGYDKVAMVTGEQAADFFDLSKRIDRVDHSRNGDGTYNFSAIKDGSEVIAKERLTLVELEDTIGKDIAQKIVNGEGRDPVELDPVDRWEAEDTSPAVAGDFDYDKTPERSLVGIDLAVGGEGMKKYYNDLVPNVVRDVLKKLGGGKMEEISIQTDKQGWSITPPSQTVSGRWMLKSSDYNSKGLQFDTEAEAQAAMAERLDRSDQPGFTLTPAMKEKAEGGMAMFSAKRLPVEVEMSGKNTVFAKAGKKVVGSATAWTDSRGNFVIMNTEVREPYRRRGIASQMYKAIEDSTGKQLKPAVSLSDDAFEFWKSFRPEAVAQDLRHWKDQLVGASVVKNGLPGKILKVSGGTATMEFDQAQPNGTQAVLLRGNLNQALSEAGNSTIDFESPPRADDIKLSTGRTATGASWESPSASKFDDMVYKFQDKQIETKRVVEAIKAAAGGIADDLNVYLNEEMFHGRAAKRTEDFVNLELNPMITEMAANGLSLADVEEFLHARHAQEANAVIAQRNPNEPGLQDGGSGMTNAEAANYLAGLTPADRTKLQAAADKVDRIIRDTRKLYVDYDLESQDTIDAWDGMFQHYIPLQREDKNASPGIGQGFSIKGKETKGRTGSTRKVVDILANVAMQRERAIVRGEKNRVAQSLIGLAAVNENPDFWAVDEVPTERVFNPATGLVEERADPMYKNRDNAVVAKVRDANGVVRERAVVFNEDDPRALRMAVALKNLDATQLEGLLGVSAKITRYFAAVNTQYNPVFGIVNLVRDVQGAMLNLTSTPLANDKLKIARYTGAALKAVYADMRAARKGGTTSSPWAVLWEEFQDVGGQTGYRDLFATSADRGEAIQKALDPTAWMDSKLGKVFTANGALKVPLAQAQKQAGFLFDWLSDYNGAMENGVRLAAYKAGLERGLSKEQAASIAKNLTTNFNRKGQVSQQAGAMYAFFNAAIQGSSRIGQTLFDMEPGKPKTLRLSAAGKKIVYGGILLGSVQAMALAAAGFGDEDPPEFTRERSLIIPTGGKTYISIPMPLGMHIIPNIGRVATEFALGGFKDPIKRSIGLAAMFADAFNPIGNAGLSMQTLAPTALDPLVALTENKDFTGKAIAKTSFNKATPGHTLGRDTSTAIGEFLSEAINTLSGGNQHIAGVFSPTPDQIDYLIGQVTGGVGREYSKVEQSLKAGVRGEALPTYKIPLVGRFIGNAEGQASEGSAFYANVDKLNEIETEAKGLKGEGKAKEARELLASRPESYLIAQANVAENQARKLRKTKSELIKSGAPREQVVAIETKITEVMARLNRAMEKLEAQSK